jgi:hypothetical protein
MAYQIKRKSKIKERLELCDETGAVVLPIDVEINVDDIAKISNAQQVFIMAKELIQKEPQSAKAQEAFGTAVIAIFAVLFGKENTDKIIAFYDGRYAEMLSDIMPFIEDALLPKIKETSAEYAQQIANAVRANKRRAWSGFFK